MSPEFENKEVSSAGGSKVIRPHIPQGYDSRPKIYTLENGGEAAENIILPTLNTLAEMHNSANGDEHIKALLKICQHGKDNAAPGATHYTAPKATIPKGSLELLKERKFVNKEGSNTDVISVNKQIAEVVLASVALDNGRVDIKTPIPEKTSQDPDLPPHLQESFVARVLNSYTKDSSPQPQRW